MNRRLWTRICVMALALGSLSAPALAADHAEAPEAAGDPAADIADFYAWHTDSGKLVTIMTFAGVGASQDSGTYDADVLYGFHIDTNLDNEADTNIWVRFGENASGAFGVQVMNLPGESGPVVGPVGQDIEGAGGAMVHTAFFDDPFFFDLAGFQNTFGSGQLAFTADDEFAGLNVTAIILSMDLAAATGGNDTIQTWVTTGRK